MNRHEYARVLRKNLRHIGEFPAGYARLGRGDGSGRIIADGSRRLVYVHDTASQVPSAVPVAQAIDIRSLNNPALEGMRVRLGFPPYAPDRVHLLGVDDGEGLQAVGGLTPQEQLTAALAVPQVANLADFRITAVGDLVIRVNPGKYYQFSTGDWQYFGGDDIALSMPSTSGYHQMQVVCLDTETGELNVIANDAEPGSIKAAFDYTTIDALTVPDGYLLCGAVHCAAGMIALSEADIYRDADPRVIFTLSGGGGGPSTDEMVKVSSNDTTGGYLNGKLVAGAGVTLTEEDDGSNETLRVSMTPPSFGRRLQTRTVLYDNTLSGAGTWDIQNIPQGYAHLEIVVVGRSTASVTGEFVRMFFNNDTTLANYRHARGFSGRNTGNTAVSGGDGGDSPDIGAVPGATSHHANQFGQWQILIPNYAVSSASIYKTATSLGGNRQAGSGNEIYVRSLFMEWESTAAINRITVQPATGNFVAGSSIQLVGIREETIGTAISEYSTANVSSPPTAAELTALFGSPATVGARFSAIINDNGAGTDEYLAWSDGTNWWYVAGTKAV